MKKIQLEARLEDKTLSVNGKRVKLDDSLFYAGISRVLNRENETALELKYQNKGNGFAENEAEDIYSFLEEQELSDKVQVNAYPEEDFSTVVLVGEMNVRAYN
ncbi:MAG TPA: hypothetical protein VMZ91_01680 [Candidatus Paceibacterota bacterium]|nr:hypothetical protein [Candidatus Paceibacterota bacterium]